MSQLLPDRDMALALLPDIFMSRRRYKGRYRPHVLPVGGCWLWRGGTNNGRPRITPCRGSSFSVRLIVWPASVRCARPPGDRVPQAYAADLGRRGRTRDPERWTVCARQRRGRALLPHSDRGIPHPDRLQLLRWAVGGWRGWPGLARWSIAHYSPDASARPCTSTSGHAHGVARQAKVATVDRVPAGHVLAPAIASCRPVDGRSSAVALLRIQRSRSSAGPLRPAHRRHSSASGKSGSGQ